MADLIKMNFEVMERSAATHKQAAATIQDMIGEVKMIVDLLENDGLVGRAGSAFSAGLRGSLIKAMTQLGDKYSELEADILGAMQDMQQADSDSTRFYN